MRAVGVSQDLLSAAQLLTRLMPWVPIARWMTFSRLSSLLRPPRKKATH